MFIHKKKLNIKFANIVVFILLLDFVKDIKSFLLLIKVILLFIKYKYKN